MSGDPVYITIPPGRFVMGDAFTSSDKDAQGRPKFDKAGKPKHTWFMGVAIRKDDPEWPAVWAQIVGVAQRDFPRGEWQGKFAWKVADGDGANDNGKAYPDYCKGHFIIKMSSGFAPQVFNAGNQQIVDPTQCKRGDYVRAYIAVRGNDDPSKPGVYISHSMVQVVGYGQAIVSGPSADQVFGAPAALPPGASATPVAPAAPMPAAPGYPPQAPAPAPYAAPPGYPPQAPAYAPPPGYPPQGAPYQGAPAPTPGYAATIAAPATAPQAPTAYPSSPAPAPYPPILQGPQPAAPGYAPPPGGPTR